MLLLVKARAVSAVFLLLLGSLALAQTRFVWQEPDMVNVDATGKIIFQRINNAAAFTTRDFMFGVWRTWQFVPNSDVVRRYDEGDAGVEYFYDEHGAPIQVRTTVDGLTLDVGTPDPSSFVLRGLGGIHRELRHDGRVAAIRDDRGKALVTFHFGGDGVLHHLSIGDDFTFTVSNADAQTLRTTLAAAGGQVVDDRTVRKSVAFAGTPTRCLDAIASGLALRDWRTEMRCETRTSWIDVVSDGHGRALLYIVHFSADEFGFDSSGKPLYASLAAWISSPDATRRARRANDANFALRGVVPDRIVVTADGRVGACADDFQVGAVTSVWLTGSKETPIGYR